MALTYPQGVGANHPLRRWPLRRFAVVEDSMRPALSPGDGLLALRGRDPRRGQLRAFRDPTLPSRWLVKRVRGVPGAARNGDFDARSDNPRTHGGIDSPQI